MTVKELIEELQKIDPDLEIKRINDEFDVHVEIDTIKIVNDEENWEGKIKPPFVGIG